MTTPQTSLYYKTPENEFQTNYPSAKQNYTSEIYSQLSKTDAIIRSVVATLFSAVVLIRYSSIWRWPLVVVGFAYAAWTIYRNLIIQDPLVELFYKIAGGRDKYEKLPEIVRIPNESVGETIVKLDWNSLTHPLYRATTVDGRRVLIVKALSRNLEKYNSINNTQIVLTRGMNSQIKMIAAFVEKMKREDIPPVKRDIIFSNEPHYNHFHNNSFKQEQVFGSLSIGHWAQHIYPSMRCEMANEFVAQA